MLLRCLSANSATLSRLQSDNYIGQGREQQVTVESPEAAEKAFQAAFAK